MGVFFAWQINWVTLQMTWCQSIARVQVVSAETRHKYVHVGSGATSLSLTVSADTTCTPTLVSWTHAISSNVR